MPSIAIRSSRITAARTPICASIPACTSWSASSPSTNKNSATASIPANSRNRKTGTINIGIFRMKLKDFIVSEAVQPELAAVDRDGAIRELVTSLAKGGGLPESAVDDIVTALVKREQTGSTGFGKGVAVPHVKHPKVKKMVGTVGRS